MRAALLAVAALIFALEAAPANAGIPRVASGGCDSTEHRSFKLRVDFRPMILGNMRELGARSRSRASCAIMR